MNFLHSEAEVYLHELESYLSRNSDNITNLLFPDKNTLQGLRQDCLDYFRLRFAFR